MRQFLLLLVLVAAGVAVLPGADAVAKKKKAFLHPEYASFQVRSIAMLPWSTRGHDDGAVPIMKRVRSIALSKSGYRFMSETRFRGTARNVGGDSLYQALEKQWQKSSELEAGTLTALGKLVSVDAILASFIDKWERNVIDYNVRGNSRTEIAVRFSLYSMVTGDLLWTARLSEEGEGPYNDPSLGNVVGISPKAQSRVRTSTPLDPPRFEEIAAKVQKQLKKHFPRPPKIEASDKTTASEGESGPDS